MAVPAMIPFSKYSGAGNDFVIVDRADLGDVTPGDLARRMCPRRTGVGVDGLALIGRESSGGEPAPIRIRFFNPDGSEFATCGNGTRCVARHARDRGAGPALRLVTAAGPIHARVDGERITLDYRLPIEILREVEVPVDDLAPGEVRTGWLVMNDTPHFVLPLDSLPDEEESVIGLCRPIRRHPAMGQEGANVNLVSLDDRGTGSIRTYERGIEDETLACGAGCISSAVALHAAGACDSELRLRTRSGDDLTVALDDRGAGEDGRRHVRLTGPAVRVFEGRYPAG